MFGGWVLEVAAADGMPEPPVGPGTLEESETHFEGGH